MRERKSVAKRCFIDTNIWLYAFIASDALEDDPKRAVAKATIDRQDVVVSTQVVNETCINLARKAAAPETVLRELITAFYDKYAVTDLDRGTLLTASELREKYSLSFWDSVIVASALLADCEVLYTEDLQDGLMIEDKLEVVNPFVRNSGLVSTENR